MATLQDVLTASPMSRADSPYKGTHLNIDKE